MDQIVNFVGQYRTKDVCLLAQNSNFDSRTSRHGIISRHPSSSSMKAGHQKCSLSIKCKERVCNKGGCPRAVARLFPMVIGTAL